METPAPYSPDNMTINQLLNSLRARWKIAAGITVAGSLLAVAYTLIAPKKYEARATVVVDGRSSDPIGAYGTSAGMNTLMSTQFDIIWSDRVARKALEKSGLLASPVLRDLWQKKADGKGSYNQWAATFIKTNLEVKPSRDSNVIQIGYEAEDPRFAAAMANAFAQAYVDVSLELRVSPARQYTQYFDDSLTKAKQRLDEARTKLSAYLRANDLVSSDERYDVELNKLNELSQQVVMMRSLSADSSNRASQGASRPDRMQEVISNPVISSIKANIVQEQAKVEQLTATLGDAHPTVKQSRAAIAELQQKLNIETRRVAESVGVTSTVNRAREAELTAAYDAQRKRVLKLKEVRDTAAILTKDMQSAELAYDAISARLNQTSLEGQANLTNVHILNSAEEPSVPAKPNAMINLVVGTVLGAISGLITAFFVETSNRRIRAEEDLEEAFGEAPLVSLSSIYKNQSKPWAFIGASKTNLLSNAPSKITAPLIGGK